MTAVPILKFPLIVVKEIVTHFELLDIIELTMMSNKFKCHIQQFKIPIKNLTYSFTNNRLEVEFNKSQGISIGQLDSQPTSQSKQFGLASRPNPLFLNVQGDLVLFEKLVRHLFTFLKIQDFELRSTQDMEYRKLSLFELTDKFKTIDLAHRINQEDFEFLMTKVVVYDLNLFVQIKYKPCYEYQLVQKGCLKEKIAIHDSMWIDFNQFWTTLHSKWIICNVTKPFVNDWHCLMALNGIMKQWQDGDVEYVTDVVIFTPFRLEVEMVKLFMETHAEVSNLTMKELKAEVRRNGSYRGDRLRLDKAMDIRRKSDNRAATVILADKTMYIVIWTEERLKERR